MPPRPAVKSSVSAVAMGFAVSEAVVARAEIAAPIAGDAASKEALARLDVAVRELKALVTQPMVRNALAAIRKSDWKGAADWCLKALAKDEQCGLAWYLLAIAREKAGDFKNSLQCYESALATVPDQALVSNDLGRLALRLGMHEVAAKLFMHAVARFESAPEPANNLASALRELSRYDEAIEVLRAAITRKADVPMLWNTLGSVLSDRGDPAGSVTFFDEALRLDEHYAKARYNRGNAKLIMGDAAAALEDCSRALQRPDTPAEKAMMTLARSSIHMALGQVGDGWDDYEARISVALDSAVMFRMPCPRWEPGDDLAGKSLILMGEQGLGDEILFANTAPDVLEALGPDGRLTIAVEPRLISLFQRSFPAAEVVHHATYKIDGRTVRILPGAVDNDPRYDLWTPMGSTLRRFRRSVDAFPNRPRFLTADPKRVKHWKKVLSALPGPKVGILWKSLKTVGQRGRYFSPFEQWAPVLKTPGVTFVNLQYGDCEEELALARQELGVDIFQPPGIDLRVDLDDVAALACALDLTLGFANATINLAAATGAACWMISTPGSWTRLGTDRMPWYPQMRVFVPSQFGEWDEVMQRVSAELKAGI